MKKLVRICAIMMSLCLLCGFAMLSPDNAQAKGEKEVLYVIAGPSYPEYAEMLGLSMYIQALLGRMQQHPALKGYKMKIVDKGMLFGTQDECLIGVASGAAQMTYSGPHFLEQLHPAWKLAEAPGMFDDWAHFKRAMDTPPWKALHETMSKEKGVTIIKWLFNAGSWFFFTDKGPVNTLADIKGQKIRIAGGEGFAKALKALGTTSVSLPYTEVVTALQTHMIDGLLSDMAGGVLFYKLPRYTKYLVPVPFAIQPICIVVNTKWYESLNKDAKTAIDDVFQRIDMSNFYETTQDTLIQQWDVDSKTELNKLSNQESKKWKDMMTTAVQDMLSGIEPKYIEAINSVR